MNVSTIRHDRMKAARKRQAAATEKERSALLARACKAIDIYNPDLTPAQALGVLDLYLRKLQAIRVDMQANYSGIVTNKDLLLIDGEVTQTIRMIVALKIGQAQTEAQPKRRLQP